MTINMTDTCNILSLFTGYLFPQYSGNISDYSNILQSSLSEQFGYCVTLVMKTNFFQAERIFCHDDFYHVRTVKLSHDVVVLLTNGLSF